MATNSNLTPFGLKGAQQIVILERVISSFSLVGCLLIVGTLATYPYLRKPINRLIGYASLGNAFASMASIISSAGPAAGNGTALCTLQGFLIQVFMWADSLWTFAMALNVYLTFFRNFNGAQLRYMERWYIVCCYGVPLLPGLVYVIIDASGRQPSIYGNAVIWCWVAIEYDWMRIAFFYAPVWLAVTLTTMIYVVTGAEIFKRRSELRKVEAHNGMHLNSHPSAQDSLPPVEDLPPMPTSPKSAHSRYSDLIQGIGIGGVQKTTEVQVTSEPALHIFNPMVTTMVEVDRDSSLGAKSPPFRRESFSSSYELNDKQASATEKSVPSLSDDMPELDFPTDGQPLPLPRASDAKGDLDYDRPPSTLTTHPAVNPIFSGYGSGSSTRVEAQTLRQSTAQSVDSKWPRRSPTQRANSAAWGYAKVAMLMFLAQAIVWIPSTVNRLYTLIHPTAEPSLALNTAAAAVLSSQGIWNALIYVSTSWPEIARAFGEFRHSIYQRLRG